MKYILLARSLHAALLSTGLRLAARFVPLVLFFGAVLALQAGDLQLFIHTPNSPDDGTPLGANYTFQDTALGASSSVTLRLKNTSTTQVYLVRSVFAADPAFSVDGAMLDTCLGVNKFEDFTVSFAPSVLGGATTPLEIGYLGYSASAGCPSTPPQNFQTATLATLAGNGTAATLNVSVTMDNNTNPISSGTAIAFGNVQVGATKTATITVQNASPSTLPVPTPSIVAAVFSQPPYSLGSLASWPASLAAGQSASFTLKFAPTQQALVTASLSLGTRSYPLTGNGIPGPGLEALLVSYTLPTGVHYTITTATPVDFGSALTGSSATYIFTVANPATNFGSETISSVSISGSSFSLSGVPTLPVTLTPGNSTSFSVVYSPTQAGSQSATLSIGTLQFTLTGKATAPTLNPSFQFSPQVLTSSQQAQLAIQLSSAAQAAATGTLALSFTSAVSGVTDDPAIVFVSNGTRKANVTFALGAVTGTFANSQSSLTFQTGTTAGTLTFTLSFADGETFSKSIDITPTPIQISSLSATKQSPYLVLNLSAFDNTYSASKMLFNFYDTSGALMTAGGISIDETQDFHNYFFLNNQAGGAFSLQAKFPVTGDITTIGAADVMIQSSSGQSQTKHVTF